MFGLPLATAASEQNAFDVSNFAHHDHLDTTNAAVSACHAVVLERLLKQRGRQIDWRAMRIHRWADRPSDSQSNPPAL